PALEPLDERRGRVGVSGRQSCEQCIVGDSPHGDYAPAPGWDWEPPPFTVALPGPSPDLRLAEAVAEEAATGPGVGVEVIGDVPHVVVDVVLDGQLLGRDLAQAVEHVLEVGGGRLAAVLPPHDHRDRADLALGDPADLVLVVPGGDPGRLTEIAVRRRSVLDVLHRALAR